MPKIRCKSCEATLNVPEKALGKTISCPKCSNKIKVPSRKGGSGSSQQGKPKKKKAAKKPVADDPFSLGNLDDYDMEDEDSQICPYCAEDVDEEDVVCRSCGMNLETGQMDRKEAKRRSRRGADPAKFYGVAWSESWKFMMKEPRMALRVGTAFSLFSTIALMCGYMGFVYVQEQMPPKVFWIIMTLLSGLSVPGLVWHLSLKVIDSTRRRSKFQSDRIQFDLFTSIAAGVRAIAWPLIVVPGTPALGLIYYFFFLDNPEDPIFLGLVAMVIFTAYFFLPLAMTQMTAKYTYKGWILWELMKILFKNITGLLYTHLMAFVALLPVLVIAVPIFLVIKGDGGVEDLNPFGSGVINGITGKITGGSLDMMGMNPAPDGVLFTVIRAMFNMIAAFIVMAPIGYVAAFPAIFYMKANGLFAYYNAETLDLIDRKPQLEPATFWVRYLSHTIDSLCSLPFLAIFLVTTNAKLSKIAWVLTGIVVLSYFLIPFETFIGIAALWFVYCNWMYWVVQESSELRSTLGKDAFGLIVIVEEGERPMTMKQASMKWLLRYISDALGGIPYLLAIFPPKKLAMHDTATKSRVVWVGDR